MEQVKYESKTILTELKKMGKLIENPGSQVFDIDRETGKLIEYDIWAIKGAGYKNVYMCNKINYLFLPKQKFKKKF